MKSNPVMNALFKRVAANPWQAADPGALSTLRESPNPLLSILPMRDVIGVQNTVNFRAKTLDTQRAQERSEGEKAAESAYRWAWFLTHVRNIATSIPVTDESLSDDPGAEDRVVTDLMGELRIRLATQIVAGDGADAAEVVASGVVTTSKATRLMGILNAVKYPGDGTVAANSKEYAANIFPSARKTKDLDFTASGASGNYNSAVLFDTVRRAMGDIEDDTILEHRVCSHLVCKGDMTTAMDLTRLSQSAAAVHAAGSNQAQTAEIIREGEYVLGGPLAGRFMARPWGLQVVRNNYGFASTADGDDTGVVGCFNSRSLELAIRRDIELRRGFVNTQFIEWESTFAAQLRVALVLYDPAAFVALQRNNP